MSEPIEEYFSSIKAVIVDPNGTSRSGISKILQSVGVKSSSIYPTGTFEEATQYIKEQKPELVVAEYNLQKKSGLDLIPIQRSMHSNPDQSLFVLVTSNSSQSAVAKAAEEDVSTYILKPYTVEVFAQSLKRAAQSRLHPSEYQQSIQSGKKKLSEGLIAEALELFKEAKAKNDKPSLACYYIGHAYQLNKELDQAKKSYEEGLVFNALHYKCLTGLYEVLSELKNHENAYEVIKKLCKNFPASAQRLTHVLRLVVLTKKFEDIDDYYQQFIDVEERDDSLIKYICAALVTCGKFFINEGSKEKAIELFNRAAISAAGRPKILREIIFTVLQKGFIEEAKQHLKRFPSHEQSNIDFKVCDYALAETEIDSQKVVVMGRKYIDEGLKDPEIYKILLRSSIIIGYHDYAETLFLKAKEDYPECKDTFLQIRQKALVEYEARKLAKEEEES